MSKGAEFQKEALARMRSKLHNNKYYQKGLNKYDDFMVNRDMLGYKNLNPNLSELDNLLMRASL